MLPEPGTEESVIRNTSYSMVDKQASIFAPNSLLFAGIVSLSYLVLSRFLVGFKTDQLFLVGLFNFFYFASWPTRRFILGFSVFILYWIVFDYMKAFPNYHFNEVHIGSLYEAEKQAFGISAGQAVLTPNEFFALHTSSLVDVLSGIFYLCWVPVPLAFAGVMFFRNRRVFFQFSLTFFLVNLLGFVGYYLYPAAPPWYVAQFGFDFNPATPGNTAGLGRFDAIVGIDVFKSLYAKSSNVFAAMPSLHASYMMIVLYYGLKLRLKAWNLLFAIIMAGIWFAAVYSGHHYILDVLAGMFCAVLGITLFQLWIRTGMGEKFLVYLVRLTTK